MTDFRQVINSMLHPIDGAQAHITSDFAASREIGTNPHIGIDLSYGPDINATHPTVFSPVDGTVIDIQKTTNGLMIQDNVTGDVHVLRHLDEVDVSVGDSVSAGDPVGTMGSKGANGRIHLHYEIQDPSYSWPQAGYIDPKTYWESDQEDTEPKVFRLDDGTLTTNMANDPHNHPKCFHAGTPIRMADGTEKPIEEIKLGDTVAAFDPFEDKGGARLRPGTVTRLFRNITIEWIELRAAGQNPVFVTPGHRYLRPEGGFAEIGTMITVSGACNEPLRLVAGSGDIVEATYFRHIYHSAETADRQSRLLASILVPALSDRLTRRRS